MKWSGSLNVSGLRRFISDKIGGRSDRSPPPEARPEDEPPPVSAADRYDARFLLEGAHFADLLHRADAALPTTPAGEIPRLFDAVPLDVFALLALHRPPEYPNLRDWLPAMPSEGDQIGSVGSSGQQAMIEAAAFVKTLIHFVRQAGLEPRDIHILDYGIFWARISRLLYKFVSTEQLHGVDAWETSLKYAADLGYRGSLSLVGQVPELTGDSQDIDVAFAVSIFTHISEPAINAVGAAVHARLKPGGLFVFTVRPRQFITSFIHDESLEQEFDEKGVAHKPEAWAKDYDAPYGTTIVSPSYFSNKWNNFKILGVELNAIDPYQLIICAQKL